MDTVSANTFDNVDTQEDDEEPSSSQVSCTDTPVTAQASVNNWLTGSVVAQLQASGVAESTVQAMVESMEDLVSNIHKQARESVLSEISESQGIDLEKRVVSTN